MKRAIVVVSSLLWAAVARAQPENFYDALEPYGHWVDVQPYGAVWQPRPDVVGDNFYPYATNGRWAHTEYGWTWQSDLPFGWVTFHHGRWFFDQQAGWLWVPGEEWAPAWVDWRVGDGYVGWEPMGPEGYVAPESFGWTFVPLNQFARRDVWRYRVPRDRERFIYRSTAPRDFERGDRRRGPDPRTFSRVGVTVPEQRLGTPRALPRGVIQQEHRLRTVPRSEPIRVAPSRPNEPLRIRPNEPARPNEPLRVRPNEPARQALRQPQRNEPLRAAPAPARPVTPAPAPHPAPAPAAPPRAAPAPAPAPAPAAPPHAAAPPPSQSQPKRRTPVPRTAAAHPAEPIRARPNSPER